ncbi:hypothetical protein BGZ57DRAFT_954811 [Hyaloscypha finlandica]|nr:hypothetical protein BGZ57DRAFT_954811 [Hyaloscypha finlandica]KAH8786411.1 hypothetical protein F5882DRAFT_496084 [Hyaloscypha sp. PMI_1271]
MRRVSVWWGVVLSQPIFRHYGVSVLAAILYELFGLGIVVYCLVRAREADHGEQLGAILASYDLWKPSFARLLDTVIGNASKPLLRVSEEDLHHLADRVDFIRHAGALIDWIRPLSDYLGQEVFKWAISRP